MNEMGEWFKGLPTWGKVGVVAGAGGLILYIWRPWAQSATAPTTVMSVLPNVAGGSPSGTNSSVSSDISSMLASSQDATAKMLSAQQSQVNDMMTAQAKSNTDMLNSFKNAQTAQDTANASMLNTLTTAQTAQAKANAGMVNTLNSAETAQANAVHQELTAQAKAVQQQMTAQNSTFNALIASLNHPGNPSSTPAPVPHYVAPVPHYVAPGASSTMQNWSQYETADRNKYNLIGGGATSIKPQDTMIANGNVIKYDNGPHGWTEYDTSGKGIRWGTASPY